MSGEKNELKLNISLLLKILIAVSCLLVILSISMNTFYIISGQLKYIAGLFSLDNEGNIPSRYASGLLITASFLFFIIFRIKKNNNEKYIYNWLLFSIIFLVMGIDESVQLHEQTSQFIRPYSGVIYFAWIIPGAVLVIIFCIVNFKFFFSLESRWKKLFFISALLYISGALGIEFASNFYIKAFGQENIGYMLITSFEEILELSGTILLIYTQLSYIKEFNNYYRVNMDS